MTTGLLDLRDVRFHYADGSWCLHIASLSVRPRSLTGIVGPNGSGKSTLLRIAAGVTLPEGGVVLLKGRPLASLRRREIALVLGYLPQETPSLFDYCVHDVVCMGRYAHIRGLGVLSARDIGAVNNALATVAIEGLRERPISKLSGGERRRAMIASVLAQEPEVFLLDEPTAGLDPHYAASLFRLLRELADRGLGILVVTHDINLASMFCDRIVIIDAGTVRTEGAPSTVLSSATLEDVYGPELLVRAHPENGNPMVLPRSGLGRS